MDNRIPMESEFGFLKHDQPLAVTVNKSRDHPPCFKDIFRYVNVLTIW